MKNPSPRTVLYCGDQTDSWTSGIDSLNKRAAITPWLKDFLRHLLRAFKQELEGLDRKFVASILDVKSVFELADAYRYETDEVGLAHSLVLHALRAAELLEWIKENPQRLVSSDRRPDLLGISGGMVNLSALAISTSFEDLQQAVIYVARVFARLCRLTLLRSRAIEDSDGGAWGWAVVGIVPAELQSAVDQFQQEMGIPPARRAKVGVSGDRWCTLVGPPSALDLVLNQCATVRDLPKNPLNIHALLHCVSLAPEELNYLVGDSELLSLDMVPDFRMWGMHDPEKTYPCWGAFLRSMIAQTVSLPLDITTVMAQFNSALAPRELDLVTLGPSCHVPYLLGTMRTSGSTVTLRKMESSATAPDHAAMENRIAIVGMSARGPGCDNVEDFWTNVLAKKDLHKEVPQDRFDVQRHFSADAGAKCAMSSPYGCFMDRPGAFDARFFHVSPREALYMDPGYRQFLMTSYEALEMAGYSDCQTRDVDPRKIGTFYGQSNDDWFMVTHNERGCDPYTLQGVQRGFAPGRIAYHFKWEGPTYTVDSACASTMSALHLARLSLIAGDIDMAVAGAANILSYPHSFSLLSKAGVLSDTGNCKTYRDDADGYCRGDFVGTIVLKRLEDAIAHNDNVLGIVSESGRNHSGNASSITTSDASAQESLFRKIMRGARVIPDDISYVEMHGTGTQVGDRAEMSAVSSISKRRQAGSPLPVGSIKANVGHSEAAAGIASLWKCLKILQTRTIPPQVGMPHVLNHNFPSPQDINIDIPAEPRSFASDTETLRILVNNFDAAGGNVSLLLEEPPLTPPRDADPRSTHVVVSSAKTEASYHANKMNLLNFLQRNPDTPIEDIAYSSTARKMHQQPLRFACAVSTVDELKAKLEQDQLDKSSPRCPPIAFVFSGQGSCYPGMGRALYHSSPVFRSTVDLCARLCSEFSFPPFVDIIADGAHDLSAKNTMQTQLAVLSLEISLAALWRSIGIEPSRTMGHSLGEYAALHVAGVLSLADVLWLVGERARLIQEACEASTYVMLAFSAPDATVREAISKRPLSSCEVACKNHPSATVVSGTVEDADQLRVDLAGVKCKTLSVPYGFHSAQMDAILDEYFAVAAGVTYHEPKIPVVSTLLGSIVEDGDVFNARYLVQQTRQPVDFVGAVQTAHATVEDLLWLELGPTPACASFIRATMGDVLSMSSLEHKINGWASISKCLARLYTEGARVDWTAFHAPYKKALRIVPLPTYAWDLKDFWLVYNESKSAGVQPISPSTAHAPISSCAAYIVDQSLSPQTLTLGVSTTAPVFQTLLDGHKMRDVSICPATVFCESALATAQQLLHGAGINPPTGQRLALREVSITRPLTASLVHGEGELHTSAMVQKDDGIIIFVSWKAVSGNGHSYNLGSCIVTYSDSISLQHDWDKHSYFVKAKVDRLIEDAKHGSGHRMHSAVFYALMNPTVRYNQYFKGIREAFISADFQEGVAEVVLGDHPPGTTFVASPFWGETLVHLAGFLVNANPGRDDASFTTLIMDSFGGFDQTVDLKPGRVLHSYARVVSRKDDTAHCEIYVFDGDRLVVHCSALRFNVVSNDVLDRLLGVARHERKTPSEKTREVGDLNGAASLKAGHFKHDGEKHVTNETAVLSTTSDGLAEAVTDRPPTHDTGTFERLLDVIAEETGCSVSELSDDMHLTELGVDSIMGIEIASKAAKAAGITGLLPSFSFEYPTIGDLRKAFGDVTVEHQDTTPTSTEMTPATTLSESTNDVDHVKPEADSPSNRPDSVSEESPESDDSPQPKTRVTLLQGQRASGQCPLYLLADGTGSIATYLHMPRFQSKMPVYGIDSPYRSCPSRLKVSNGGIPEAAGRIVQVLTKFQPEGPLFIGGFSGGAMMAYEVCLQLIEAGRTVDQMLLIDMCCPRSPGTDDDPDLASRMYDSVASTQVGSMRPSDLAQQHLKAMFACVAAYHPAPIPTEHRPRRAAIIWAQKGLIDRCSHDSELMSILKERDIPTTPFPDYMQDGRMGSVFWSLAHKTNDFLGPNGWDEFVGEIRTWSVDADHLNLFDSTRIGLTHAAMEEAIKYLTG